MLTRGALAAAVVALTTALGPRLDAAVPGPPDRFAAAAATPPAPADAGSWRPFRRQGSRPVGFDPCRTVTYVAHVRGEATAAADEEAVHAAVADAARASGLRFRYAGRTETVPRAQDRPGPADALWVGWADERETDLFAAHGDALGVGGSDVVIDRRGREVRSGGFAAVRTSGLRPAASVDRGVEAAILRHELAHALGLDHVADPRELLYHDVALVPHEGYGPGDRRGLWELGAGQGCG